MITKKMFLLLFMGIPSFITCMEGMIPELGKEDSSEKPLELFIKTPNLLFSIKDIAHNVTITHNTTVADIKSHLNNSLGVQPGHYILVALYKSFRTLHFVDHRSPELDDNEKVSIIMTKYETNKLEFIPTQDQTLNNLPDTSNN